MKKLYDYYRSTAAFRVRIALNYKQVAYDSLPINLAEGEQFEPKYLAINPQMRVPTLLDDDFTLGQSMAILEYLEALYPHPPLLPAHDIQKTARIRAFCYIIACDMHPLNNLSVLNYLKNNLKQEQESVTTWYHHWLKKGFDALNTLLLSAPEHGPFCFGEDLSMADVCLIPQIFNAFRFEFPMDDYPKLLSIHDHCMKLEAFDRAKP